MVHSRLLMGALAASAAGCAGRDGPLTGGPLPPCTGSASTVALAAGAYAAYDITADSGCAVFPANTSPGDSAEYLVVVQSAGGTPGDSALFRVAADVLAPVAPRAPVRPAAVRSSRLAQAAFDRMLHARARRMRQAEPRVIPPADLGAVAAAAVPPVVGSLRTFTVCAAMDCNVYTPVVARALTVGAHVALYQDTLAPAGGLGAADVRSLGQIFDQRVYPLDTLAFGRESDSDGNGVVIVLLTNVINRLVTPAQCSTNGYVTGFFDAADLDPLTAAQRNHGEVYYGLVPDPAGTLSCAHGAAEVAGELPTTFAHEFEHMISFVQHVLVRGGDQEDEWLDEGLAKYAEELTAASYLPGDPLTWLNDMFEDFYEAGQYLLAPEQHFLLTTSDLDLPDVGAGWLFVHYLVDRSGAGITRSLVRTTLTGTANVAQTTGVPFATTLERWALANWVSDLPGFSAPPELRYPSWSFRFMFGQLHLLAPQEFPRPFPLVPAVVTAGSPELSGSLRAGSGLYLRVLQGPGSGPDTLRVNAGLSPLPGALVPQFAVIRIR